MRKDVCVADLFRSIYNSATLWSTGSKLLFCTETGVSCIGAIHAVVIVRVSAHVLVYWLFGCWNDELFIAASPSLLSSLSLRSLSAVVFVCVPRASVPRASKMVNREKLCGHRASTIHIHTTHTATHTLVQHPRYSSFGFCSVWCQHKQDIGGAQ